MSGIQSTFLPRKPLQRYAGIELFFVWEPLEEVGGDYVFTSHRSRTMTVEIGDVMGHGMGAALAMTALHGVFFGLRESSLPPQQMVSVANKFICRLASTDQIVTSSIFLLQIDVDSGLVTYTNAGHPYPLYYSSGGDDPVVLPLITGGPVLGVKGDLVFQSGQLRARPEDFIVMFTDGFLEASNANGEMFMEKENLAAILKSCASLSAEQIAKRLRALLEEFRQGVDLQDDLTLVVLRFTDRFKMEGSSL